MCKNRNNPGPWAQSLREGAARFPEQQGTEPPAFQVCVLLGWGAAGGQSMADGSAPFQHHRGDCAASPRLTHPRGCPLTSLPTGSRPRGP